MKVFKKKNKRFNIINGKIKLNKICDRLPNKDEVFKFISKGGFSSISFIMFIAEKVKINNFYVSTLRVGKKELQMIDYLHRKGKINNCNFIIGSLMANDSKLVKSYNYYNDFKKVCNDNNWSYVAINNHSKILLFDTFKGKFVIETSSNLNENPKIEQFSFEKSEELFDFYLNFFKKLKGGNNEKTN